MNKKELYMQVEELHDNFKNKKFIESTEDDVKAFEEVMDLIMLGAGAFTTDELISELMKREGTLVLEKVIQNLDDGAVG